MAMVEPQPKVGALSKRDVNIERAHHATGCDHVRDLALCSLLSFRGAYHPHFFAPYRDLRVVRRFPSRFF